MCIRDRRMNMAYIRPGGVAQDLPAGAVDKILATVKDLRHSFKDNEKLLVGNSIWMKRTEGIRYLDLAGATTLGVTGPIIRATGLPLDLRKIQPYSGYENYKFDVVTADTCDVYGRFLIRINELEQSLRIIEQCAEKLKSLEGAPVTVSYTHLTLPTSDLV